MSVKVTVIGYGNVGRVLTSMLLGSNQHLELNIMDPADWISGAFLDLKHALGMRRRNVCFIMITNFSKHRILSFSQLDSRVNMERRD